MSNNPVLEAIEQSINHVQEKLQKQSKNYGSTDGSETLREWLKCLHEKRNELLKQQHETIHEDATP
ncbi:MAG: hypothetical protein HY063_03410 [Bacteroidetes bacterium]|nr:hypothetical protein [Bacteroidota bacterium]